MSSGSYIKRRQREIEAAIAEAGGVLLASERGPHLKFRFRTPDGRERLLVTSSTPNNPWMADRRVRADIKRMMRSPEFQSWSTSFLAFA